MTAYQNKIIYDFGSNNGDDIPYYLKKSDVVVAIEANPELCDSIKEKFTAEIEAGRLFVENCVLTTQDDSSSKAPFYIHKYNHVLSQFPEPEEINFGDFDKVILPSKSVLSLIEKYGKPYYIKIDIEHYDDAILRDLFLNKIHPPYISAESHDIKIFSNLVSLGSYNAFKLMDGVTVSKRYKNHPILSDGKCEYHSFPHHSAGPFGEDIPGDWMSANSFFRLLAFENLGWKDIHATNLVEPNPSAAPKLWPYVKRTILNLIREKKGQLCSKLKKLVND